jgi:Big-like domain-containing protein
VSNPTVVSVTPANLATDVILGTTITVTFSTLINPATITTATFSLTGPAQTQILTPTQLIASDPNYITGRNFITGTFSTATVGGVTVLTFTPKHPLQPNSNYTVLLIGSGAILVGSSIEDLSNNPLADNYQWSFSTGDLNTNTPPAQAPLPYQYASIDPATIKVQINDLNVGSFLNQNMSSGFNIELIFPAPLDDTSFATDDILLSLEQFLGDPTIPIPTGLTPSVSVSGSTITITLS